MKQEEWNNISFLIGLEIGKLIVAGRALSVEADVYIDERDTEKLEYAICKYDEAEASINNLFGKGLNHILNKDML